MENQKKMNGILWKEKEVLFFFFSLTGAESGGGMVAADEGRCCGGGDWEVAARGKTGIHGFVHGVVLFLWRSGGERVHDSEVVVF